MKRSLGIRAPHVVVWLALLAVVAATLHAIGRPWWCKAGDLALWSNDVLTRHNSQHLADPYTVTHVLHGIALYGLLWLLLRRRVAPVFRLTVGVLVEAAWEIVENTDFVIDRYRAATISLDYYGDSVANSLGDNIAFVAGYVIAAMIPWWVSAMAFFVVDGLLVLWIRDSLLLNVLMLVHPVDAVKSWQSQGPRAIP